MKQITLGKTGLRVTRLGFGGIPIQRVSESQAVETVRHAVKCGVDFIDTANISVTDADGPIDTLTAQITNISNASEEFLAVTLGGADITAGYVAATGTLTLTNGGAASNADFQTVLETLTYNNTSTTPTTTDRVIQVIANDGALPSVAATTTVDMSGAPLNQAPVVDLNVSDNGGGGATLNDATPVAFVEAGGPVDIIDTGNIAVTDADGDIDTPVCHSRGR